MEVWQNGQGLLLGGAAAGARFIWFAAFTTRKITNATIKKSITLFMNAP